MAVRPTVNTTVAMSTSTSENPRWSRIALPGDNLASRRHRNRPRRV
jgi:hypothetical protein